MNQYLIDIPLMASLWVTAKSKEEALKSTIEATTDVFCSLHLGDNRRWIRLFNLNPIDQPECIGSSEEGDGIGDSLFGRS